MKNYKFWASVIPGVVIAAALVSMDRRLSKIKSIQGPPGPAGPMGPMGLMGPRGGEEKATPAEARAIRDGWKAKRKEETT